VGMMVLCMRGVVPDRRALTPAVVRQPDQALRPAFHVYSYHAHVKIDYEQML
jgi:hypothetical protein